MRTRDYLKNEKMKISNKNAKIINRDSVKISTKNQYNKNTFAADNRFLGICKLTNTKIIFN